MKYNGIIENKLRLIEQKIAEIESWNIGSFEEYDQNRLVQNASERVLQVAIEAVIDVAERVCSLEKVAAPQTSVQSIRELQKLRIISDTPEYENMIRFRNFIVHIYDRIDNAIVYDVLKNKLFFLRQFADEVRGGGNAPICGRDAEGAKRSEAKRRNERERTRSSPSAAQNLDVKNIRSL